MWGGAYWLSFLCRVREADERPPGQVNGFNPPLTVYLASVTRGSQQRRSTIMKRIVNRSAFNRSALSVTLLAVVFGCSKEEKPKPETKTQAVASATPSAAAKTANVDKADKVDRGEEKSQAESDEGSKNITKASYGKTEDGEVSIYTVKNKNGLTMKVLDYGAIVTEFHVPGKDGKLADIAGGFDQLEDYVKSNPYMGATVGRVGNRIKDGKFTLEGKEYTLATNNGPHHLHGGEKGWDKVIWKTEPKETPKGPALHFTYVSDDGEEGYPGTVTANVTYTLTHDDEFLVDMEATTDKTTLVNMVHHTYWNLAGHDSGTILDQELMINADQYTPGKVFHPKSDPVPDGTIKPVAGTPFDFNEFKPIGKDIKAAGGTPVGYDHNWIVNGKPEEMRLVAKVKDPKSGRMMTIEANQPGVQFYAGIFLDGTLAGKGGHKYPQYGAFCIETQAFVNAINVPEWKDQVILKPGETYKHNMVHKFTTEGS